MLNKSQGDLFADKDVNASRNLKVSIHRKIPVCAECRLLYDDRFDYEITVKEKPQECLSTPT